MNKTVIHLQTKLGLKPDGEVGPKTSKAIAALFKLGAVEAAHLLGQCYHETGGFQKFRENLNYSAAGLANTWPDRYALNVKDPVKVPNALAFSLERNPVAIANTTYANRMGNGDVASGDGWKYRGVGAIHLTGKTNVERFAAYVKRPDLVANPDPIEVELAFEAGYYFFFSNNLFKECKDLSPATIRRIGNAVNRGNINSTREPLHAKEREAATIRMFRLLTQ